MLGFTTTRRHKRELAAVRAESARLRTERNNAVEERNTAVFNREQVLAQNAGLASDLTRLIGRNTELCRRLDKQQDSAAASRLRVAREAASRILAAYRVEKRRADHLQARLDQALGLDSPAVTRRLGEPRRPEGVTAS